MESYQEETLKAVAGVGAGGGAFWLKEPSRILAEGGPGYQSPGAAGTQNLVRYPWQGSGEAAVKGTCAKMGLTENNLHQGQVPVPSPPPHKPGSTVTGWQRL